jgi:hypothetical protein
VQATDRYTGVRGARIVLLDNPDLVRATITASWLYQLGLDDVFVYSARDAEQTDGGPAERPVAGNLNAGEVIRVADLAPLLAAGATLLDLEPAPPYFQERLYIPGSIVARRSTLAGRLDHLPGTQPVILTSADGALARLAAAEFLWTTKRRVLALAGGTAAWIASGRGEPGRGSGQPALDPSEALPQPPTLEERRAALAAYVQWGDTIVGQLERDGLTQFR